MGFENFFYLILGLWNAMSVWFWGLFGYEIIEIKYFGSILVSAVSSLCFCAGGDCISIQTACSDVYVCNMTCEHW